MTCKERKRLMALQRVGTRGSKVRFGYCLSHFAGPSTPENKIEADKDKDIYDSDSSNTSHVYFVASFLVFIPSIQGMSHPSPTFSNDSVFRSDLLMVLGLEVTVCRDAPDTTLGSMQRSSCPGYSQDTLFIMRSCGRWHAGRRNGSKRIDSIPTKRR